MKGFGKLLLYFFTWRSVIIGSVLAGTALLAMGFGLGTLAPQSQAGVTLVAFVLMLVVPYISAPKALRALISNRRLAMVPGLPLRTGMAMLFLTLVVAGFLPFWAWMLGAPELIYWLGLQIFIVASLYTLVTQLLVTSPRMWLHMQWMPIGLIVFFNLSGEYLLKIAANRTAVTLIASLALACWIYVLLILARRPIFKPAYATDVNTADQETNSLFSSWVNRTPDQAPSAVSSLMLGYPANLRSRAVNMGFLLIFNPLISVLLMKFLTYRNGQDQFHAFEMFLGVGLLTNFITGAVSWAETGARARLLWLRVPGARAQVWAKLERELWQYFLLMFATVAIIAAVMLPLGASPIMLMHYGLLLFTLAFYQRYLPLAARLNGWSSLGQSIALLASLVVIAITVVYSLTIANFNLFFLLELCLLLLGVLFRSIAKFGFKRADWQVLRPAQSKRVEAAA